MEYQTALGPGDGQFRLTARVSEHGCCHTGVRVNLDRLRLPFIIFNNLRSYSSADSNSVPYTIRKKEKSISHISSWKRK